jgi:hypothetical protein
MALIIEDGTIVAGANSLATTLEYRAYLESIGIDTSADTDAVVDQALIRGLRALCPRYEPSLSGCRVDSIQLWCVPRISMYAHGFLIASDTVPDNFKYAQILFGYKSKTIDLSPDLEQGKFVTKTKDKVSVLETEIEYAEPENVVGERLTTFTEIEEILKPYFKQRSAVIFW